MLQLVGVAGAVRRLNVGAFVVDLEAGTITPAAGGRSRHVPAQAIVTLLVLAEARGAPVSRGAILEQWPDGLVRSDEALAHAVHALREAFEDNARQQRYIKTLKQRGYALGATIQTYGEAASSAPSAQGADLRRLWSVAAIYVAAAGGLLQAVSLDVFGLSRSAQQLILIVLVCGFPLALMLTWWLARAGVPGQFDWLLTRIPQKGGWLIVFTGIAAGIIVYVITNRPPPPPPPPPSALSVAVLPFPYEGGNTAYAYLGEGIPDELIALLSRLPGLQVISRTVTFDEKLAALDLRTLGVRLQVAHVVEGRVEMENGELRVTVKLVDTDTGRVVWSAEPYQWRLGSVFDLYDTVVTHIAQELQIKISPDTRASFAQLKSSNEDAYALYLEGREMLRQPAEPGVLERADDLFRRALEVDPGFARAHAGLCEARVTQYRATRDGAFVAPAAEACNRALELDPAAYEVQLALTRLYMETNDLESAERAVAAALKLNPRGYEANLRLGDLRWRQQRIDEAEAAYQTAIDLQPGNWMAHTSYGALLLQAKADYPGAEAQFLKVLSLTPESTIALSNLGACYMYEGKLQEAVDVYQRLLPLAPNGESLANLGLLYYYLGRYADAVSVLEKATELAPSDHRVVGNLALAQSFDPATQSNAPETYARAIALAQERLTVDAADADALADVATYYAALGNADAAQQAIAQALKLMQDDGYMHYLAAVVYALLGEREQALTHVRAALDAGQARSVIQDDARLRQLIASAGSSR